MEILPPTQGQAQDFGPGILDLQLARQMILSELHWPLNNRAFVTTICALSAGRPGWFPYGHEFVALTAGYDQSEEANRKRVQRDLMEYERAQYAIGRRLFEFKRGGGKPRAVTQYGRNFLNLAALQVSQQVSIDSDAIPTLAKISKHVPQAIESLPYTGHPKPQPKRHLRIVKAEGGRKCPLSKTLPPVLSGLAQEAVKLAREGFFVVPLHTFKEGVCSCKKGAACEWPGKHPRISNWLTSKFPSEETIVSWWRRWSDANVGIRTGVKLKNGQILVVLDSDKRRFGHGTLAIIEEQLGEDLSVTLTITSGDGDHRYWTVPEHLATNCLPLGRGVDVKAKGGLVVARGTHFSGRSYHVSVDASIARMPDSLAQLIFSNERPPLKMVSQGERHKFLLRCGSKLAGLGFAVEEIVTSLRDRLTLCEPGGRVIEERELLGIAEWAVSKESSKTQRRRA